MAWGSEPAELAKTFGDAEELGRPTHGRAFEWHSRTARRVVGAGGLAARLPTRLSTGCRDCPPTRRSLIWSAGQAPRDCGAGLFGCKPEAGAGRFGPRLPPGFAITTRRCACGLCVPGNAEEPFSLSTQREAATGVVRVAPRLLAARRREGISGGVNGIRLLSCAESSPRGCPSSFRAANYAGRGVYDTQGPAILRGVRDQRRPCPGASNNAFRRRNRPPESWPGPGLSTGSPTLARSVASRDLFAAQRKAPGLCLFLRKC